MSPIYDYYCDCGLVKEIFCRHSEATEIECPSCHNHTLRRVTVNRMSNVGLSFVGSGWPGQEMKLKDKPQINTPEGKKEF